MNALIKQKALAIKISLFIIIASTWQCGRLDVTDLPKNRDIGFILDTGRGGQSGQLSSVTSAIRLWVIIFPTVGTKKIYKGESKTNQSIDE